MKEQFVSYEIALKLKELDFDEECFSAYTEDGSLMDIGDYSNYDRIGELDGHSYYISCLSPLWQQVIDWCREVKNINVEVWYDNTQDDGFPWLYEIYIDNKEHQHDGSYYDSFYEAREQAILKAIELIKK